jgi:hypothetical protein
VDDWSIRTIKSVLCEELTEFFFNEHKHFFVINHIALVEEYDDVWYTHLLGKKYVLTCLWHRTVGSSYHEYSTVHLGSTSNHVLDVVSVTWRIDVRVVTVWSLVLRV